MHVQGFKKPINQFVFKELAIVPLQEDAQPTVYLFEPPNHWHSLTAKYKSENAWTTRNYHGLEWASGDIPYEELRLIIRDTLQSASAVYVEGLEKKKWMDQFLKNVYNLEDLGCPSLKKLYDTSVSVTCNYHHPKCWNPNCDVRNAFALKTWYLSSQDQPSVRHYTGSKDNDDDDNMTKSIDETDMTLKDYYNKCEFLF